MATIKNLFFKDKNGSLSSNVHVHFVGIGGIGMGGLAELLWRSGSQVTGSDLTKTPQTEKLKTLGISVSIGHSEKNISSADVVVYSSAIPDNNVELISAQKQGISVISRSEALSEIMRLKRGIVVAGTHGKTTTTGFLSNIFVHNGKDPTVFVGGRSHLFESTARLGEGEWFIAESDESDGGFQYLSPEIAVLTNIDRDHLDYYGCFEKLKAGFLNFVSKVPFYGCVIAWGDDPTLRELLSQLNKKIFYYGFNKNNHFVLKKIDTLKYQIHMNQQNLGVLTMPLPGQMNALNALAAGAVALTLGFSFKECQQSFAHFKGVDRRFQKKGETKGIDFYDDYAHHPTEIQAVLSAFREKFGTQKRLIVLFQPHRFSRTKDCWSDFLTCFTKADQVFLTDIYPASEQPLEGISSQKLALNIKHPACSYCEKKNLLSTIPLCLKQTDVFITMGAGSVYQYGEQILQHLQNHATSPKKTASGA